MPVQLHTVKLLAPLDCAHVSYKTHCFCCCLVAQGDVTDVSMKRKCLSPSPTPLAAPHVPHPPLPPGKRVVLLVGGMNIQQLSGVWRYQQLEWSHLVIDVANIEDPACRSKHMGLEPALYNHVEQHMLGDLCTLSVIKNFCAIAEHPCVFFRGTNGERRSVAYCNLVALLASASGFEPEIRYLHKDGWLARERDCVDGRCRVCPEKARMPSAQLWQAWQDIGVARLPPY